MCTLTPNLQLVAVTTGAPGGEFPQCIDTLHPRCTRSPKDPPESSPERVTTRVIYFVYGISVTHISQHLALCLVCL